MILAKNIHDMNNVREILDNIRINLNAYEKQNESVLEEKIEFQICEIDEFIIGFQKHKLNNTVCADIRMMLYWDYIENKIDFYKMIEGLRENEGEI